jgi:hypothetical protein
MLQAPLEYLLVLMNEVHLFKEWLPFVGDSQTLLHSKRCLKHAWVKLESPFPWLVNNRDACLECKAIDGLDEDGSVLVLIKTHVNSEKGPEVHCPDGKNERVIFSGAVWGLGCMY